MSKRERKCKNCATNDRTLTNHMCGLLNSKQTVVDASNNESVNNSTNRTDGNNGSESNTNTLASGTDGLLSFKANCDRMHVIPINKKVESVDEFAASSLFQHTFEKQHGYDSDHLVLVCGGIYLDDFERFFKANNSARSIAIAPDLYGKLFYYNNWAELYHRKINDLTPLRPQAKKFIGILRRLEWIFRMNQLFDIQQFAPPTGRNRNKQKKLDPSTTCNFHHRHKILWKMHCIITWIWNDFLINCSNNNEL
jgi:hypothetical protein